MNELGIKIAKKRNNLGMTQTEFGEKMCVTRQTVSRWEAGTVMPDIDKIEDIANILGVSCDYLLKDEVTDEDTSYSEKSFNGVGRLLETMKGKKVKLVFFDDEEDMELYNTECVIEEFEGNWMKVSAKVKKGQIEKLIPLSGVCSIEIVKEAE